MSRVYATAADLLAYTGQAVPEGAEQLLARASEMLDSLVFRLCVYAADPVTGLPTEALVAEAFRKATCAQVQWWGEVGDSTGAASAGWGSVQIGSVSMSRSVTAVSGADSAARQIAPQAGDALRAPDLTPDLFELGAVSTW